MTSPIPADAIVVGAGAAGLMCAAEAGKRGRRVILLEHSSEIARKILISGGGRCNFTNLHCTPEHYISSNPHFHKSALARFTQHDFLTLVKRHRIPYHEKTLGQLFCDRSARDIVGLMRAECEAGAVHTVLNCSIADVRRSTEFIVETNRGTYAAPALVVATGGLSIPKMGATSFGYDLARKFGLRIAPCRPALVPLTFRERDRADFAGLAGVASEVIASIGPRAFRERFLVTHRGLSGPAVLQISSYWDGAGPVRLNLLPGKEFAAEVARRRASGDKSSLKTLLADHLPKRLADRWLELNGQRAARPDELERSLQNWAVTPSGTEGYEKAEVTAGGVHPDELSSKTLESRKIPGLYFIGEVVDVTGHLGGFNFQWAWSSGWVAGQSV